MSVTNAAVSSPENAPKCDRRSGRIIVGEPRRITLSHPAEYVARAEIAAIKTGYRSLQAYLNDQIAEMIKRIESADKQENANARHK